MIESKLGRFACYGLLGWCAEVAFTGAAGFLRTRDRRLPSHTSLWSFPIYGLLQPLYEPLHDTLRGRAPAPVRGAAYATGILAVEYTCGRVLRAALGEAPWDYSYARHSIDGLARPDWFPFWAVFGLAAERVHDHLVGH